MKGAYAKLKQLERVKHLEKNIKYLVIAYCIGLVLIFTIVPWNVSTKTSARKTPAVRSVSYGLIFAPPPGATEIKYKQVVFEVIGLSAIAGIAYWYIRKATQ